MHCIRIATHSIRRRREPLPTWQSLRYQIIAQYLRFLYESYTEEGNRNCYLILSCFIYNIYNDSLFLKADWAGQRHVLCQATTRTRRSTYTGKT